MDTRITSSSIRRSEDRGRRRIGSIVLAVVLAALPSGCGVPDVIGDMIAAIERTRETIASESEAWRETLAQLSGDLAALESKVAADARAVATDTVNQVRDMTTDAIELTAAKATKLIADGGAELRCNADFVREGVVAELDHLAQSLRFWEDAKQPPPAPPHAVCAIVPNLVTLNPTDSGWVVDGDKMPAGSIIGVYGYNFRPEALPRLELRDNGGDIVRDIPVLPAYVTRYQLNLDLATESFNGVARGYRIVLVWPDLVEANTISLSLTAPAHLVLVKPETDPASPIASEGLTRLSIDVVNDGGARSGSIQLDWRPDPEHDNVVITASSGPLEPQSSITLVFDGYRYEHVGEIQSSVSISAGGNGSIPFTVIVRRDRADQTCQVDRPAVTRKWSFIRDCRVRAGDRVEITDADGCVNVGGDSGLAPPWLRGSTKHFVDPEPGDNHFGMIAIKGTIEESERKPIRDLLGETIVVEDDATVQVGYQDNEYGDNSYDYIGRAADHVDPGVNDQCLREEPASLTIEIYRRG